MTALPQDGPQEDLHGRRDLDRRSLGRALSRSADAGVAESLERWRPPPAGQSARRIGITGAPGTGKSTLISHLARHRLPSAGRLGVLAVDPSSPYSRGAILGDRIRMDAVVDDPGLFIRSLASRHAHDGLADNIADLLSIMDAHGFDEVILETVGVGQTEYGAKALVDTFVLVLIPESGDQIQAMKAGLMETADVYVVNKADLPRAGKVASEVRATLARSGDTDGSWRPRVLEASATDAASVARLSAAIDEHHAWASAHRDREAVQRLRKRHHIGELVRRRVAELVEDADEALLDRPLPELYAELLRRLAGPSP
ncbi:ArgK/MeaB family GTPase [Azospirillum doebereinerae]